jgi:hypothetical protein
MITVSAMELQSRSHVGRHGPGHVAANLNVVEQLEPFWDCPDYFYLLLKYGRLFLVPGVSTSGLQAEYAPFLYVLVRFVNSECLPYFLRNLEQIYCCTSTW